MNDRKPVICVYSNNEDATVRWFHHEAKYRVSLVHNLALLGAAIDPATNDFGDEFVAVILDQSVSAKQFLDILATLPQDFRGDVLRIDGDGLGFLSTCALREGRYIYRLDSDDVEFYLDARFGIPAFGGLPEVVYLPLALTA